METFIQLYAKHIFNIPLPDPNKVNTYCRECGGIISDEGYIKNYSANWTSEGVIFNRYPKVCEACLESTKGKTTRALITPLHQKAIIVHRDGIIPERFTELANDSPKEKGIKEAIHGKSLTIREAIEKIHSLPVPYGIYCTIGDATKVANNFLKDVHLNYSNEECLLYILPIGEHIAVKPGEIFNQVNEIKNRIAERVEDYKKERIKASDYRIFSEIAEEYKFTPAKRLLMNYLINN